MTKDHRPPHVADASQTPCKHYDAQSWWVPCSKLLLATRDCQGLASKCRHWEGSAHAKAVPQQHVPVKLERIETPAQQSKTTDATSPLATLRDDRERARLRAERWGFEKQAELSRLSANNLSYANNDDIMAIPSREERETWK